MRSQPIIDDMKIKELIFVFKNEILCNIKNVGYNSNSLHSISIPLPPLLIHFKSFLSS